MSSGAVSSPRACGGDQENRLPLHERTKLLKAYVGTVIPGFLQAPGYATALLSAVRDFHGTPDDVADAVAARMQRKRSIWPLEAFTVFDDTRVYVELLSAQVTVTAPSEIVLYARAFEKLSGLAVFGDEARARITDAIDALQVAGKFPQVPFLAGPRSGSLELRSRPVADCRAGRPASRPQARGQEHARPHRGKTRRAATGPRRGGHADQREVPQLAGGADAVDAAREVPR
jgi:Domain of unknown function (DUF5753)